MILPWGRLSRPVLKLSDRQDLGQRFLGGRKNLAVSFLFETCVPHAWHAHELALSDEPSWPRGTERTLEDVIVDVTDGSDPAGAGGVQWTGPVIDGR